MVGPRPAGEHGEVRAGPAAGRVACTDGADPARRPQRRVLAPRARRRTAPHRRARRRPAGWSRRRRPPACRRRRRRAGSRPTRRPGRRRGRAPPACRRRASTSTPLSAPPRSSEAAARSGSSRSRSGRPEPGERAGGRRPRPRARPPCRAARAAPAAGPRRRRAAAAPTVSPRRSREPSRLSSSRAEPASSPPMTTARAGSTPSWRVLPSRQTRRRAGLSWGRCVGMPASLARRRRPARSAVHRAAGSRGRVTQVEAAGRRRRGRAGRGCGRWCARRPAAPARPGRGRARRRRGRSAASGCRRRRSSRRSEPYGAPQRSGVPPPVTAWCAAATRSARSLSAASRPDANCPPHHSTVAGCSRSHGSARAGLGHRELERGPGVLDRLVERDAEPALGDQQVGHAGRPVAGLHPADRQRVGHRPAGHQRVDVAVAVGLQPLQRGEQRHELLDRADALGTPGGVRREARHPQPEGQRTGVGGHQVAARSARGPRRRRRVQPRRRVA